jgi:ABC-type cobalamin transport system permease subunit
VRFRWFEERRQQDLAIWGIAHRRAFAEVIEGGLSALALARLDAIFRSLFAEEGVVMR